MQIVSEQRDRSTERGKEKSLGQECPVEDPWGVICASKTHTHMDVYMCKEAVKLVFSQI